MKNEERQALLIDYAEGVLPKDRKGELEALIASSPEIQEELELIRSAFRGMNDAPSGTVPEHYFTNFLPRLRQSMELGKGRERWYIPPFIELLIRPALVLAAAVVLIGSYRTFEPQSSASPIYALVSEFAQDEIADILTERSVISVGAEDPASGLSLGTEAFGLDIGQYQSESELSTILEEQELEQVVQHLERNIIH